MTLENMYSPFGRPKGGLPLFVLFFLIIILVMLLAGCSSGWHLKRAQQKDPTLFDTTRTVSVDTVIIETAAVDTAFAQVRDTLIVYTIREPQSDKDVIVKYLWNTKTDSVFIEVDCPDQEVITNTITETNTVYLKPSFWEKLKLTGWILLLIGFMYLVVRMLQIYFNAQD